MCHRFLCGSVHTNGMSEWQHLTLLLQNGLGSQRFPNWLRLHATSTSFTQASLGAPANPSFCCFLSEKRGSERCIKVFNLCKYHFPGDRL